MFLRLSNCASVGEKIFDNYQDASRKKMNNWHHILRNTKFKANELLCIFSWEMN